MTAEVIAAAVVIAFVAAACQSLTAFGFALVMVPLLSLAWEVKPAVVTSTVLSTLVLLPLLYEVRGHIRLRRIVPLFLGSLVGVPAGVIVLVRIDAIALEVIVAVVVILAGLLTYFAPPLPLKRSVPPLSFLVGIFSGALRGATSMGGPPVVLYTLTFESDVERFRATLLAFFLPMGMVTVAGLAIAGQIDGDVLLVSAAVLPAVVVGSLAGRWARALVSESVFRAVVLGVLLASSGAVLALAAGDLG